MTDSHAFALSIVVPVYNGAASVPPLVEALAGLNIPGGHEIVLVNDGSPDNSLEVCTALCHRYEIAITVVNLTRNFGEHNAVMAGLRMARGAYIITMTIFRINRRRRHGSITMPPPTGSMRSIPITPRSSTASGGIWAAASPMPLAMY
jgi:hypothetical protein